MGNYGCPGWSYSHHPSRAIHLPRRVKITLDALRRGSFSIRKTASDTRNIHGQWFANLTPPNYPHYAGNYRGQKLRCLAGYDVEVKDVMGRVILSGTPAPLCVKAMEDFEPMIVAAFDVLDELHAKSDTEVSVVEKIRFSVRVACEIFIEAQKIHPYADGNGHIGRFLVWLFLGKYGYWPEPWTVEPRPRTSPEYHLLLRQYDNGNTEPLVHFIYKCIPGVGDIPPNQH